jgi:hypothetical protein
MVLYCFTNAQQLNFWEPSWPHQCLKATYDNSAHNAGEPVKDGHWAKYVRKCNSVEILKLIKAVET